MKLPILWPAPVSRNLHYGAGAGRGAPEAHAGGGAVNGKPPAPKANAKQHPKAPPANGKNEEKTAQR